MNPQNRYDAAVVGAGILGLAHAYHLARAGLKVVLFERNPRAVGASIRNFGMIWPIGQPPGEMREIALRSREIWLDVLSASGIWHDLCGSMHLAHHQDEVDVLMEFAGRADSLGYKCQFIPPTEAIRRCPVIRKEGIRGALWSQSELCVYPRQVIAQLPHYLETLGVDFHFCAAVTSIDSGVILAGGEAFGANHVFVCTGDDFETLFPERFTQIGMTRSKLQMMRLRPHDPNYRIGAHLCAGLTLGHYANFQICEKLPALLDRFKRDYPEHVKWGIHLLVSQHEDGCLTVGDSHEYGLSVDPFLSEAIERLMLGYLDTMLDTSELEVIERWHGVYAKHFAKPYVTDDPAPGVRVVTGVGGAGMTLSFGLAERQTRHLCG